MRKKHSKRIRFTRRFWILLFCLIAAVSIVTTVNFAGTHPKGTQTASLPTGEEGAADGGMIGPRLPEPFGPVNPNAPKPAPEPASAEEGQPEEKIAYLTFDDGPSSQVTPQILDTLKQYNVHATFFLLGDSIKKNPDLVRREYNEGHKLANHSFSHDYDKIYASAQSLLEEIIRTNQEMDSALGFAYGNTLFRFPGGSFGRTEYQNVVKSQGYSYVDWNCLGKDAEGKPRNAQEILQAVRETTYSQNPLTILLHDTNAKPSTAEALPSIIEYLQGEGYTLKPLSNSGL